MSAARRAAVFLAFSSEPALSSSANDAAALDEYCLAAVRLDALGLSDAELAAAGADADAGTAAAARAFLASRRLLRQEKFPGAVDVHHRPPRPSPVDHEGRPLPGVALVHDLGEAFALAAERGYETIGWPREALAAFSAGDDDVLDLLRAAFSRNDEFLIRAMARDFDVAELRMAQRLANGRPLRKALPTTGAAFRGVASREKALEWSARLRSIRNAGRKKRGALAGAVEAAAPGHAPLIAAAASADRIWDAAEKAPPVTIRMQHFCDALETRAVGSLRVVPVGASGDSVSIRFGRAERDMTGVICTALEREPPEDRTIVVDMPLHAALAAWVAARISIDHEGRRLQGGAWPEPEAAQPVVAPAMTFSASRLNLYAKCPRRWFFEYLCSAVDERSTANAVYGKVFHAALEALHREVRVPPQWDRAEVLDKLCSFLDASFGQAHREFASQLEYEVLRLRARRVARHYVRWLYEEAADAPFEVVEIESRQQLLLGGHRFVGYIDRIDRPAGGGPITIFDYKTGRVEDDPDEYLRQIRDGEEAQLALYYAMRRAQGDRIARIALVSIRDTREKTWVLALDIAGDDGAQVVARADRAGVVRATCTADDIERSLSRLLARCDILTGQGVEHFAVGSDPPCSYCSYAAACRERPRESERIFAR